MCAKKEATLAQLEDARERVSRATDALYAAFLERQKAMREIALAKAASREGDDLPVLQINREICLLSAYRQRGIRDGLDPEMVELLVWAAMTAGKLEQLSILGRDTVFDRRTPNSTELNESLTALARTLAGAFDRSLDEGSTETRGSAIRKVIERERTLVRDAFAMLDRECRLGVDLACATGESTKLLANLGASEVIGIDASQDMIAAASRKQIPATFKLADLKSGIPLDANSVDFLTCTFGAASCFSENCIEEVSRVLKPSGFACLSFLNKNALANMWWRPWKSTLGMIGNPENDTLYIPHIDDNGNSVVYTLDAGFVNDEDVIDRATKTGLIEVDAIGSSPLWDDRPTVFFRYPKAVASVEMIERSTERIRPFFGQYIRYVFRKL